jgi:hypothetical protein
MMSKQNRLPSNPFRGTGRHALPSLFQALRARLLLVPAKWRSFPSVSKVALVRIWVLIVTH